MKKNELKKITIDFSYWMKLIPKFWKISGNYEKLNSEFDLNIEVSDQKDKKFIIKIMRYPCDKVFLEGQIDFLKFIEVIFMKSSLLFKRQISKNSTSYNFIFL